jgi:hypothetical protein
LRCRRMTVWGLTSMRALRQSGHRRTKLIHKSRSMVRSATRLRWDRCRTESWCRSARISIYSEARVRRVEVSAASSDIRRAHVSCEGNSAKPQGRSFQLIRSYWQGHRPRSRVVGTGTGRWDPGPTVIDLRSSFGPYSSSWRKSHVWLGTFPKETFHDGLEVALFRHSRDPFCLSHR